MRTIIRSKLTHHYTILPNAMLRDKRLSFRARGVLAMILTHSEDWSVSRAWLRSNGTEGRDALTAALVELKALGYAAFHKEHDSHGRIFGVWTFKDVTAAPGTGTPETGNPSPGEPVTGNQHPQKDCRRKNNNRSNPLQKKPKEGFEEEDGGTNESPLPSQDKTATPRSSTTQSKPKTQRSLTTRSDDTEEGTKKTFRAASDPSPAGHVYLDFYNATTKAGYWLSSKNSKALQNALDASGLSPERFRALLEAAQQSRDPFLSRQVMDVGSLISSFGKLVALFGVDEVAQPSSGGGF